jgi:hypothetical protein
MMTAGQGMVCGGEWCAGSYTRAMLPAAIHHHT